MKDSFTPQEYIKIISHFSNQGEGGEHMYDVFEKYITEDISQLSMKDVSRAL